MDVQVRTDYHVDGDDALIAYVDREVSTGLDPFARRITSVHVHLSEESGARRGPHELRCLLEVRPSGHPPLAVTTHAATKDAVVRAAVADMRTALGRMFGRLDGGRAAAETIRRR